MFTAHKTSFMVGDQEVKLETGVIARQADGAVLASMGDVTVLAACTASRSLPNVDFFPLTVNYIEKTYATGKIPGGFFKREARPSEKETLTSRLIDRPLRPLFPKGFRNEVQVICTVLSSSGKQDPDVVAMIAASAAVTLSGVPFEGPMGAARVSVTAGGDLMLNPPIVDTRKAALDMVVAGSSDAILMVESRANELTEAKMLDAVLFGHEAIKTICKEISDFADRVNKPKWDWQEPVIDGAITGEVATQCEAPLREAYAITDKGERSLRVGELRGNLLESLPPLEDADVAKARDKQYGEAFDKLAKQVVRGNLIAGKPRIDGRPVTSVRPIDIQLSFLPRVHGAALFTRGETQAIVTTTLAALSDAKIIDALEGEYKDNFMLHYNFPPYCVGEVGFLGAPKRREIGHGALARRGIQAVLPDSESFPYTLRVVSEITESNGSSSMATVCGASLALMDAGAPITRPVAGVAMGLVKEPDGVVVLTDILGDEDHLGDMDFKVAGTDRGVTALQMDIKIAGINREIMQQALAQARDARIHILGEMAKHITTPREEVSPYAPSMRTIKINPDKIREVIGKGGAVIRQLVEETGAQIDIEDSGLVRIYASTKEASDDAIARINNITAEPEVGKVYDGTVVSIVEFGAFVSIMPGKEGLVHVSEIANKRVENVRDYLSEGQNIKVLLKEIDGRGRIRLSMKAVENAQVA